MEPILKKDNLEELILAISSLNESIKKYSAVSIPDTTYAAVRKALNKVFTDKTCRAVFVSNNTDKQFFGVFIKRPINISIILHSTDMDEIVFNKNWNEYSIDLDSKLFGLDLDAEQITSLILYDVYKIVDKDPIIQSIACIDAICAGKRETFTAKAIQNYGCEKLLEFAITDYTYRAYSIFTRNENELIRVPEFLSAYELDSKFVNALEPVFKITNACGNAIPYPAISINWAFSMICRYAPRSTDAMDVLNCIVSTSGSTVMCNFARSVASNLFKINASAQKLKSIGEASLFTGIRKNGLKTLENDLFEYEMRVKNIDDENSAIFLMRQINSRMGIISDYLDEEKISDNERRRWNNLYERYDKLRIKMTSKPIYSRKMYGLFTDYNALMQPGSENLMTMQTVY